MDNNDKDKHLISSQALLDSVDYQLQKSQPPEARETYDRLLSQGYSDRDARQLIGLAVENESFMIRFHHEIFDLARYVATLRNLPRLPFSHA
ncbi:MAG: hypothetical protein H7838_04080 [Magnetococcus sp. DMHC-8]